MYKGGGVTALKQAETLPSEVNSAAKMKALTDSRVLNALKETRCVRTAHKNSFVFLHIFLKVLIKVRFLFTFNLQYHHSPI